MTKSKLAKLVRIATLPPFMAALLMTSLLIIKPAIYRGVGDYLFSLLCLTLLPLSAYPLQPHLFGFKHGGRDAQRDLAMVMSVLGYILGFVYCLATGAAAELKALFLIYLLSVTALGVFNRLFKIKASGHACGAAGPIAYMYTLTGPIALLMIPVFLLMCWSSVSLKRHTYSQLALGACSSVFVTVIVISAL